jgi:protease-4
MKFLLQLFKLTIVIVLSLWVSAITILGILFVFAAVFGTVVSVGSQEAVNKYLETNVIYGNPEADSTIVSIPIKGLIVGDDMDVSDPFGLVSQDVTYGYEVKSFLAELSKDDSIAGIVLDVNSPGGTIYGANAIAEGVRMYREKTGKPVLAFVSGVAASGAYWAAASADEIIADIGTSVGSIGVIAGPFQYFDGVVSEDSGAFTGGVVTERGIETTYITAGESKDVGNPYRRLTEKEADTLQQMVNNEYKNFVSFVSERRNIPQEEITSTIGAMLYDTTMAMDLKLIDTVGSRDDVFQTLATMIGEDIENIRVVRDEKSGGLLRMLLEAKSSLQSPIVRSSQCVLSSVRLAYHGDIGSLCTSY